jgi:transcription initiation factor TFIIB
VCSICKRGDRVITDSESAEIICSNCGAVISDKIQENNRQKGPVFSSEEVNYRVRKGSSVCLDRYDMGLYTIIGRTDRDATGHKLDAVICSKMTRLRMWDTRTQYHTSTDRNLMLAFNELSMLRDKLGLSSAAVEKTAYIYRKALIRGLIKGRSITALLAASAYAACRQIETPWTMKDIAAISNIKQKHLAKAYSLLVREFDYKVPMADPMKCIVKVANKANLSEKTKRKAISIMKEVTEKEISAGKDPMGLAATVLYISCLNTGIKIKQEDISNAAGITGVTLRNRLKDLKGKLDRPTVSGLG